MNKGSHNDDQDRIAIIAMAGRFPGAADVEQFWRNLHAGVESITFFSRDELAAAGVAPAMLDNPNYVRANGVLDGIELFDAEFFGFTPREAEVTDPQHRVFLECAWEALETAGYDSRRCSARIGVYAGAGPSRYLLNNLLRRPDLAASFNDVQVFVGNNKDFVPTRVCYKLDLKGPGISVNTACSSSLVAVHVACQALLDFQCDMALAGGVGIQVPQQQGYLYHEGGIGSPDGHCRAFDAEARGTVGGNGVGIVVLKRLEDALADGDHIGAVIRGSAVNNDGADKVGYTAPSVSGQAAVIAEAQSVADFDPQTMGYVETHGTGTPLGDPVEIAALTQAFGAATSRCAIGSVKTNVGHLDEAAGVAGLIKTVLALQHREIPPSLHYQQANAEIDFDEGPFVVNSRLSPWPDNGLPRRAGVSSFGIGGTNAHMVVEEAPQVEPSDAGRPWQLLPLSARTQTALDAATANLARHLEQHPDLPLADAAYTLGVGRREWDRRRVVLASARDDALQALATPQPGRVFTADGIVGKSNVVLMFPGQGAQHVEMGHDLYRHERGFRELLDHCAAVLQPQLGFDLRDLLFPENNEDVAARRLAETAIAQPAIFVVEYCLAKLWTAWGVKPEALIGHSLGEYVAACLAGVFELDDALSLVAYRGQLMQQLPAGAMLAVPLPEDELRDMLDADLSLAVVNAPSRCVVSGNLDAIARFESVLAERDLPCRRLETSHAFHCEMVEPILDDFKRRVAQANPAAPEIPYLSNLTGTWISPQQATDPNYWASQLRNTVRFDEGLRRLLDGPHNVFLEVGPGQTLTGLAKRHPQRSEEQQVLASMPDPRESQSDLQRCLETAGRLWLAGVPLQWSEFYAHQQRRRVPLPTYPFERRRYWIDPPSAGAATAEREGSSLAAGGAARADGKKSDVADWFYVPSWKRSPKWSSGPDGRPAESPAAGKWLVFADACGLGETLAKRLAQAGNEVVTVHEGPAFERSGERSFLLNPACPEDYRELLAELARIDLLPTRIAHSWSVAPREEQGCPSGESSEERESRPRDMLDLGFYSVLYLTQAWTAIDADRPLTIEIIANGLFDVMGDEPLFPEKAAILGPCRVIPQEHVAIRSRLIDIVLPPSEAPSRLPVETVLAELANESAEQVVALRGERRWLPIYEPVRLEQPTPSESCLRPGGVYLITGGLGGIGLILAEMLATTVQARLVLVGRNVDRAAGVEQPTAVPGLPRGERGGESRFNLEQERETIERREREIDESQKIRPLSEYDGLSEGINRLCASYALDYLKAGGVEPHKAVGRGQLRDRLGIQPGFERFFDYLIAILAEDGIVRLQEDRMTLVNGDVPSSKNLFPRLRSAYPEFVGTIELLDHCAANYGPALSGRIPAIGVLYPEGKPDLLEDAGRRTKEHTRTAIYVRLLQDTIRRMAGQSPGKKLRVLEAGIGDGILARALIPVLAEFDVEYWATDIGPSFLAQRQREADAAGVDFVHCRLLDLNRDPVEQGFEPGSFDLAVALDVVHATRNLDDSIGRMKRLLVPDGMLALIEAIRAPRWITMIWGLAEGWWDFQDTDVRPTSPLVGLGTWQDVCRRQGFDRVAAWPNHGQASRESDYGLILAQLAGPPGGPSAAGVELTTSPVPTENLLHPARAVRRLKQNAAEVHLVQADVSDEPRMREVIASVERRFERIDGVIHAAGETRRDLLFNTISEVSRDKAEAVFRARLSGTRVLEKVLRGRALDFCLLVSSNAAVLGGLGLGSYSAANAFLDAFAASRLRQGDQRWISANWDSWPTEEAAGQKREFFTSIDRYGMTLAESQAAVERIVAQVSGQVVVSSGDLHHRLERWVRSLPHGETEPADNRSAAPAARAVDSLHHRPNLPYRFVAPVSALERASADIWQEVFGIDQIGVDDNFFDLDGDSLLGTQLIARLAREFEVDLPFRNLFEHPTLGGLASQIEQRRAARKLLGRPQGHAGDGEEEGEI